MKTKSGNSLVASITVSWRLEVSVAVSTSTLTPVSRVISRDIGSLPQPLKLPAGMSM